MFLYLQIKNYIFIKNLSLELSNGLNIFTGETGAGKSIIVEAISLLCGEKISTSVVGPYADKCELVGIFDISNVKDEIKDILENIEINDELVIRREIDKQNKSRCFINDNLVSLSLLKSVCDILVDIHGQNEHQKLLSPQYQLVALDKYSDIEELVKEYKNKFNYLKKLIQKKTKLEEELVLNKQKIDLLNYQINEIEQAKLTQEDEKLEEELEKAKNAQKIISTIAEIKFNINEIKQKATAIEKSLQSLSKFISNLPLENLNSILTETENIENVIDTYKKEFSNYTTEFIDNLIDRVDLIKKLKRKYGSTIQEIKNYYNNAKEQLNLISSNEEELEKLSQEIEQLKSELVMLATKMSKSRTSSANKLQQQVNNELSDLGFKKAKFEIKVETLPQNSENLTPTGFDKVEFLISTNPGTPFLPLREVASGGELSRIMLVIKTVLGKKENTPVLIFDEIDSGVGGPVGFIIGKKLKQLSLTNKQIFCITHLPQIACFADKHFFVNKEQMKNKTLIMVDILDKEKQVQELARMLSGAKIDDTSIKHAKNLLEDAKKCL